LNGDTYMAGRFVSRCGLGLTAGRWRMSPGVQGRKTTGPIASSVLLTIPADSYGTCLAVCATTFAADLVISAVATCRGLLLVVYASVTSTRESTCEVASCTLSWVPATDMK
jgi:hypothetical protein